MNNAKIPLGKIEFSGGGAMQPPEMVDKILNLHKHGLGQRRIARELGIHRKTVKRYLRQKKWLPYQRSGNGNSLKSVKKWLEEAFYKHRGNAAVVHQELERQLGIKAGQRTVQYAVQPFRKKLIAKAVATIRFETPPGKQMQIDFGSATIVIGGIKQKIHFFAAVLGYSRRQYVQAFRSEKQSSWLNGIDGAFRHFGGVSKEILLDNARALVSHHNPETREVIFNEKFHAFARYWGFKPKACAPYRARTKGKDENTVKYIKHNAIAGREFPTFAALEEHLAWWMREVSDERIHGTTGEKPLCRFKKEELELQPLEGRPPFLQIREFERKVHSDACIEVDTNFYSVPWALIGEKVTVQVVDEKLLIYRAGKEVASHYISNEQRGRYIQSLHLQGIIGSACAAKELIATPELLRPLAEYEAVVGGRW
jgi:transposase